MNVICEAQPSKNYQIGTYGQGLARVEERGHLGTPGAAVYRHILDRMNAINES